MKVLQLGVYDIKGYSRGRILYKGLLKNKVIVKLILKRNKLKYFSLATNILKRDYDVLLVTGKITFFISKLLKFIHKKPIIFDAFISDYDNLVNDRKLVKKKSLKAKLLWLGDKYSCKLSDYVILDTKQHIKYFVQEFCLDKKKFKDILIGADEDIFFPKKKKKQGKFVVSFHGTFIPLQGIEYIIKAAKLLEDEYIRFEIIGNGQTYNDIVALAKKLEIKNIDFLGFKKIKLLPKFISKADVCLGIFGNTEKTKKVIPNKAYEIIAMKKCLITADTPATKELFVHKKNAYLCKVANAESLANAILTLKKNQLLRTKIGNNGYDLFKKSSSTEVIGKKLVKYIRQIL